MTGLGEWAHLSPATANLFRSHLARKRRILCPRCTAKRQWLSADAHFGCHLRHQCECALSARWPASSRSWTLWARSRGCRKWPAPRCPSVH